MRTLRRFAARAYAAATSRRRRRVETVGLTYATITINNPKAKTSAADDWSGEQ